MLKITYYNEHGYECECVLKNPDAVDHSWWSHNRGIDGKFVKHDITCLSAFLSKIPGKFSIKQLKDD